MSAVRQELRRLVALAVPVVGVQLGMMGFGIVDLWMVARLGSRPMAAVSVANVVINGAWIAAVGVLLGLDPIVSQAHGARRGDEAGRALQRGIVLAVLLGFPVAAAWHFAGPLLRMFGQDPTLLADAQAYCRWQTFSAAPMLVFMAMRQYLQGRTIVAAPLLVVAVANVLNALLNWVFIFGHLGAPAMGLRGAALATGLTRVFLMVALFALVFLARLHRDAWVPWSREAFRLRGLAHVLRYGLPIAAQLALEVWAFGGATLLAGAISTTAVAAHAVVLQFASLSFMVPLGVSIAAATRVGNLLGAGDREGAQRAAWVALVVGAGFMLLAAVVFVAGRGILPRFYASDAEVVGLAATIFPIAAAFQLFDGTQVVGTGVLRGMGDTRPAAWFNFLGYYAIALPGGIVLAFGLGRGLAGVWWGLCAGLGIVAALLVARIAVRGPRTVTALAIPAADA